MEMEICLWRWRFVCHDECLYDNSNNILDYSLLHTILYEFVMLFTEKK